MSQIITELYGNAELENCIRKFIPPQNIDDFKQELFLVLLEKDPKIISKAHTDNTLLFYVVRVIINLATQQRNVYQTKYIDPSRYVEIKDWVIGDEKEINAENKWGNDDIIISERIPCEESWPFEIRKFKEEKEDKVIEKIMNSEEDLGTPYYKWLAEALREHGSAGKVAKATGIPKSSIQVAIKKMRKYLQ